MSGLLPVWPKKSSLELEISNLCWPAGLDEQRFLDDFWQTEPLLIRQAFPGFRTPVSADELAGLSLEPDIASKLITCDKQGEYHLEFGPFDEARFESLPERDWSLLVTDIEKHLTDLASYLQPFRFLPDWRIDDLMISYAPDGASVGAHIDEYDVFLLQASGVRRWSIDAKRQTDHQLRQQGDLKILQHFDATDTWDLMPGDMLYLPPGIAHHGIAVGTDCTTWSIGFRAPLISDMVARLSDMLSERMRYFRFRDGPLKCAIAGEISTDAIASFKQEWDKATHLTEESFSNLIGQWLTESSELHDDRENSPAMDPCGSLVQKAPFSRFAWIDNPKGGVTLFVDGVGHACSKTLAIHLAKCTEPTPIDIDNLEQPERLLMTQLISEGSLLLSESTNP